jgi:hypothetical protein
MGIDQHRQQLTVPVWDDRGEVVLRRQVSTQWDKVRAFLDDLTARAAPTAGYFADTRRVRPKGPVIRLSRVKGPGGGYAQPRSVRPNRPTVF